MKLINYWINNQWYNISLEQTVLFVTDSAIAMLGRIRATQNPLLSSTFYEQEFLRVQVVL